MLPMQPLPPDPASVPGPAHDDGEVGALPVAPRARAATIAAIALGGAGLLAALFLAGLLPRLHHQRALKEETAAAAGAKPRVSVQAPRRVAGGQGIGVVPPARHRYACGVRVQARAVGHVPDEALPSHRTAHQPHQRLTGLAHALLGGPRRDLRAGLSTREIQRTRHVTWRTVKAAESSAWPASRAAYPDRGSKLDPFKPVIEEMLVADLDAPRKQRHTARRVWQRLMEEEGAVVAESTVRNLVAGLRAEVAGSRAQVMIVQEHPPGEEAEVDFGEFRASIGGVMLRLWMFCMRLSHSGRAFHYAYANHPNT